MDEKERKFDQSGIRLASIVLITGVFSVIVSIFFDDSFDARAAVAKLFVSMVAFLLIYGIYRAIANVRTNGRL